MTTFKKRGNFVTDQKDSIVGTTLVLVPNKVLDRAIASELNIPDPDSQAAQAALNEVDADEDTNGDEQAG
jgi:hypothetical protein